MPALDIVTSPSLKYIAPARGVHQKIRKDRGAPFWGKNHMILFGTTSREDENTGVIFI